MEERAASLRLRSRNQWLRGNYTDALQDILSALRLLGTEVNPNPTQEDAEGMFDIVKNKILAVGFHEILAIPRTSDSRTELAIELLNDAGIKIFLHLHFAVYLTVTLGTSAYWSTAAFSDVIGLTVS